MGNVEYAECYAELANAIVLQAFKDYRKALFKLVQEPEEWKHRSSKKKLERFFPGAVPARNAAHLQSS